MMMVRILKMITIRMLEIYFKMKDEIIQWFTKYHKNRVLCKASWNFLADVGERITLMYNVNKPNEL